MGHSFTTDSTNGTLEGNDRPTVKRTINGEETELTLESRDRGLFPLDPGGWYGVGLKASFDTNSPVQFITAYEVVYHPLGNITSIRDIIPEALVGSFNYSPRRSNELGCAAPESGAVSHLRESTGAFLLMPMLFVWYALRYALNRSVWRVTELIILQ